TRQRPYHWPSGASGTVFVHCDHALLRRLIPLSPRVLLIRYGQWPPAAIEPAAFGEISSRSEGEAQSSRFGSAKEHVGSLRGASAEALPQSCGQSTDACCHRSSHCFQEPDASHIFARRRR